MPPPPLPPLLRTKGRGEIKTPEGDTVRYALDADGVKWLSLTDTAAAMGKPRNAGRGLARIAVTEDIAYVTLPTARGVLQKTTVAKFESWVQILFASRGSRCWKMRRWARAIITNKVESLP